MIDSAPLEDLPSPPTAGLYFVAAIVSAAVLWIALAGRTRSVRLDLPLAVRGIAPLESRLDLNTARPEELTLLPGIGPRLAVRIVTDRHRKGRFEDVSDLQRVPGLGPAAVSRVRPFVIQDRAAGER